MAHRMDEEGTTLTALFVAMREHGPICEEVPAHSLGGDRYELLSSPGLALNLARGDIVETGDGVVPATMVERGGNFCIHVYVDDIPAQAVADLERDVGEQLRGTLDGTYRGNLALTVPASAGMPAICRVFDAFTETTGLQWYFANIYLNFEDVEDETLLDWWE